MLVFINYCCRFAYVRQEDLFFSQLTVRETLSLATELQLPHISSEEERDEFVNNLLFKIGLVGSLYLPICLSAFFAFHIWMLALHAYMFQK